MYTNFSALARLPMADATAISFASPLITVALAAIILKERVRAGGTVIMTTHILEVAERMADRIGVIAHGRLIAEGTLDELRGQSGGATLEDVFLTLTGRA